VKHGHNQMQQIWFSIKAIVGVVMKTSGFY